MRSLWPTGSCCAMVGVGEIITSAYILYLLTFWHLTYNFSVVVMCVVVA